MNEVTEYLKNINWTLIRDTALILTTLTGLILLLVASGANAYANLMNSGNLLFMEQPWIAISLSTLPAFGSLAVKLLGGFLPEQWARRYMIGVVSASVVSLIVWAVTFSLEFHNNAGAESLDQMLQSSGGSFAIPYTISQTLAEILVAAALFYTLELIHQRYSSDRRELNPAYLQANEELLGAKHKLNDLKLECRESKARHRKLSAIKDRYIQENMALHMSMALQAGTKN